MDPIADAGFREGILAMGIGGLLPPRLAPATAPGTGLELRDTLTLPGGALLAVIESLDEVLVVPLIAGHGPLRRAVPGDGAFEGILRFIGGGERSGAFSSVAWTTVPGSEGERSIDVDQSNESVAVGEQVVVKLYPRTAPGPQPGMDVPAHLAAVGFGDTPAPIGALRWADAEGRDVVLASAAAFLAGARDGWDWFVELVLRMLDGDLPRDDAEAPAAAIGSLVARLHVALAAPSAVLPEPVATASAPTVRVWAERASATLDEALSLTSGAEGDRLRAMAPRIRAALGGFDAVASTPIQRIHGDLHVGQVLRWDGGYAVSDFDGNPLAPPAVRTAPDSPARDVASMARAIDHVGRIAHRRRPDRAADIDAWIRDARVRFLAEYRAQLGAHRALFDERLLRPFEVAQECHEYVYAARYLPRWLSVPDLAMPALLEEER